MAGTKTNFIHGHTSYGSGLGVQPEMPMVFVLVDISLSVAIFVLVKVTVLFVSSLRYRSFARYAHIRRRNNGEPK